MNPSINTKGIESKLNGASKDFSSTAHSLATQAENFSHETGKVAGEMISDLAGTASDYVQSSRRYIEKNPLKSAAIAAVAGLALGTLFVSARRRN